MVIENPSHTRKPWGGHLLYFYSIMSVHWLPFSPTTSQKHAPISLTEINWIVPYWVLSKLKSMSCSFSSDHIPCKFNFLSKYYISLLPLLPFLQLGEMPVFYITLWASKMYPFCPKIAWIHTLITCQSRSVAGVEKHTLSLVFDYGNGFRCGLIK